MRSDSFGSRITRLASTGLVLTLGVLFALPATAAADEWLTRINNDLKLGPNYESVEEKLFPLIAAMDPVPFEGDAYLFFPEGSTERRQLIDWVSKPAQQAVIEAVREIGEDPDTHMWSLQFGEDKVPDEWVDADLYIGAGEDGLSLVHSKLPYLHVLREKLRPLSYSNGIKLAAEGSGDDAMMDHARFLTLYRLMLDRPLAMEKLVAISLVQTTANQMTDLAYQYTRGDDAFTATGIADALLETDETILQFRRFLLPIGDVYLAQEAFDYASRGGPRVVPDRFAIMLASISDSPGLSRMGDAVAFRDLAPMHADRLAFEQQLNDVVADYTRRWNYTDLHDRVLRNDAVGDLTASSRFYILRTTIISHYSQFEKVRLEMLTQLSGMRCALGVVAFYMDNSNLPGRLVAIQPEYVRTLQNNLDYLNYNQRIEQSEPLTYWVPMRDERFGPSETPTPYPIRVVFSEYGMPTIGLGVTPATRSRDLMEAIPVPGFRDGDAPAISDDASFEDGGFSSLIGISAIGSAQAEANRVAQRFFAEGTLPRFGLSAENHAALEQYLSGDSSDFDFAALRDLLKDLALEEGMTEMDAQQFSVALAAIQTQGITPDNAGEQVRQQLRGLLDMFSGAADPLGMDGMDTSDDGMPGMENLGGAAMLFAGGDINETLTNAVGKNADQIIDYIGMVTEKLAEIPSLRNAIEKANRGEFMTASEAMRVSDDMIDALVTPAVMNPLRDMVVHLKNSEIGQTVAAMPVADAKTTPVVFAVDDSSFLLYSVGRDGQDDRAALIDVTGVRGDYLFWPPPLSLYREYLNR